MLQVLEERHMYLDFFDVLFIRMSNVIEFLDGVSVAG